jgi:molybdopterin-guanine dinucleotide biosynthesis protein
MQGRKKRNRFGDEKGMKVVCVTGATSGVGKTTLAEKLLSRLSNWAACKVTACVGGKEHRCPRGKSETCGVCASLRQNYVIEEADDIINMPGTDTGRLLSAGAMKVLWIKSKPAYLHTAIDTVMKRLQGFDGVVFEGNHALKNLVPDLAVMVLSADGRYKRSAKQVIDRIDLFFTWENEDELLDRIIAEIHAPSCGSSPGETEQARA